VRPPDPAGDGIRVLVVEDEPEIGHLLATILAAPDREVILAGTAARAEAVLGEGPVHLVILDLVLPDADGRSLLRALRARPATANAVVVVLTGRGGHDLRAECFELGCDAFLAKPFDPGALAAAADARLEWARARPFPADRDRLTGLLNVAGLTALLGRPAEEPRVLALAELDDLRAVYDRYGWGTAEMIVAEVGRALAKGMAPLPVARSSQGEFAVLLPVSGGGPEAAAARLLDVVRRVPVRDADGETFRLTASAAFLPDERREDPPTLIEAVRARVQRGQEEGGNRVVAPGEGTTTSGAAPLVLVAEDDDITAKILVHRLEKDAFRVLRFDNGDEAYRGALHETPALVVLDVKMPGMDGFEVLSRLRKTPSYARVPVMMLTSMGSEADVVRGFDLGADDYMLKPFSPTELLARIRRLLRRGHQAV